MAELHRTYPGPSANQCRRNQLIIFDHLRPPSLDGHIVLASVPERRGVRRRKPKSSPMNTSPYDNLLADVPTDLWIAGKWQPASDGARFEVTDPGSEAFVASVASAQRRGRARRRRCRRCRRAGLGGEEAPRARRDSPKSLRADPQGRRAPGEADDAGERQVARRFPRRGRLCRRVLPLERGGGGAEHRPDVEGAGFRRAHPGPAQAGRRRGAGHARGISPPRWRRGRSARRSPPAAPWC